MWINNELWELCAVIWFKLCVDVLEARIKEFGATGWVYIPSWEKINSEKRQSGGYIDSSEDEKRMKKNCEKKKTDLLFYRN